MITLQIKRHTHPHMLHVWDIIYLYICHKYAVWFLCDKKVFLSHGSHHGISFHHSKMSKAQESHLARVDWPYWLPNCSSAAPAAYLPEGSRTFSAFWPRGWELQSLLNLKGWRGRRKSLSGWYDQATSSYYMAKY